MNLDKKQKLEQECNELNELFGTENLQIDLLQDPVNDTNSIFEPVSNVKYTKIRITHIPTQKVVIGCNYDNQLENFAQALNMLKAELFNNHQL